MWMCREFHVFDMETGHKWIRLIQKQPTIDLSQIVVYTPFWLSIVNLNAVGVQL
jgi:hypothetical protein